MKSFRTASRRRTTIGLTGVALVAALAASACSGSSGGSSGGKQTLTITGQYSGPSSNTLVNWWKAAAVEFKKTHPDVTVKINNIVTTSESTYYSKLDLLERSSSTSPNVVYEDSFLVQSDAAAGYLAAMPQLKNFSEWKALYPTFQKVTEYNGTPYAMMTETDVQQIYFDKALLVKAGLPANWKPTTLNSILTAAEAIKAKEPGVIPLWVYTGTPLGEASSFRGFQVLLLGTNSRLYDQQTGKWETGGPGFNQVFNFLATLHKDGLEEPTSDWSNPNAGTVLNTQLMPAQKVAMAIDGSWVSTQWLPGQAKPWSDGLRHVLGRRPAHRQRAGAGGHQPVRWLESGHPGQEQQPIPGLPVHRDREQPGPAGQVRRGQRSAPGRGQRGQELHLHQRHQLRPAVPGGGQVRGDDQLPAFVRPVQPAQHRHRGRHRPDFTRPADRRPGREDLGRRRP